ncbi:MAG: carbohydrate porin [Planctomycetaceae bacterium]
MRFPLPHLRRLARAGLLASTLGGSQLALAQELPPVPEVAAPAPPADTLPADTLTEGLPEVLPGAASPLDFAVPAPICNSTCPTATPLPAGSPFAGPLWQRPKLLGNWLGTRDALALNGIGLDVSTTQFYQGVTSGGISEGFEYGGRGDYLLNVDGEKAGLWKGSFLTMHGETRYGDTVNARTGAIMPVNSALLFPRPTGTVTALTSVKYTQFLSESLVVFGGKLNLLDELNQPYASGRGVDAFMNTGLIFPAVLARTAPYSTFGGGFAVLENLQPVFSMMVLDTNNTPTTTGFDTFFDNGVTLLAQVNRPVEIFGLPGHQGIGGSYSTATYSDLSLTPYFDPNTGVGLASGQTTGSWSLFYLADQALWVDAANPKRSWGLFGNVGIADDGPSPVRWSGYGGVGGSSPLATRPLDTFGVGYFYVGYSSPVQDLAPRLLSIGNDQGVELFYNAAITPWFHLTPDLQFISPARGRTLPPGGQAIDDAVVFGLRAKIDF